MWVESASERAEDVQVVGNKEGGGENSRSKQTARECVRRGEGGEKERSFDR